MIFSSELNFKQLSPITSLFLFLFLFLHIISRDRKMILDPFVSTSLCLHSFQVTVSLWKCCPANQKCENIKTKTKRWHQTFLNKSGHVRLLSDYLILAQNKTKLKKKRVKSRTHPCPQLQTPSLRPRQECWERQSPLKTLLFFLLQL